MSNKYLLKPKRIRNIRIFQERSTLEQVFDFPDDYLIIAQRYVQKLNESGFLMQGNNYFMVHFTRQLANSAISFENETKWDEDSKGKQEVNAGVDPLIFNSYSEDKKGEFITKLIAKILIQYIGKYHGDTKIIKRLESLILKHGGDLEVIYKTKETKKYKLIISYQTKGHDKSYAIIEYIDKLNAGKNRKVLVPLRNFFDIDDLIAAIRVKDDKINIKNESIIKR